MISFNSFVGDMEKELERKLMENELEFVQWLYARYEEEEVEERINA
ncbi:hypothetical protein NC797_11280 [Aquibacillus sp. 3ASR75-11]|uniref:Uncharacterized protein n=1 Tax=Terrihalobacillus insolitus TaxID=2950438 RepID=A0A9X3WV15_9BACI|nr:hypothetical protein [Terrihalobacillus insolitus]MDC3414596.1 hypothetical protein [Terrihalobacillus insolitus]MDC3425088.1 hypothetical protein [Terrihalobacillus insolitus]